MNFYFFSQKLTFVDAQLVIFRSLANLQRTYRDGNNNVRRNNQLDWYRQHKDKFPYIAQLARRIVCIPATSAPSPSERLFSQAGLTIAKDRANLLPEMAESLVFLQDAWDIADEYMARIQLNRNNH